MPCSINIGYVLWLVTAGYSRLQEVTGGVTEGYIRLHKVTVDYRGYGSYSRLQKVTVGYIAGYKRLQ